MAISSNNMLHIFDASRESKPLGVNPYVLMTLNLTEEGLCNDPSEIVGLDTSKTPHNSYKRDNSDLRPEDLPFITFILKNGS